jgi:hypothetical protein
MPTPAGLRMATGIHSRQDRQLRDMRAATDVHTHWVRCVALVGQAHAMKALMASRHKIVGANINRSR